MKNKDLVDWIICKLEFFLCLVNVACCSTSHGVNCGFSSWLDFFPCLVIKKIRKGEWFVFCEAVVVVKTS